MTKRIEMTLDASYVPGWKVAQAMREIFSNAIDAEKELGAKMTADWYNNTVRVENEGTTLPLAALLQGYSTKREKRELIGQWGEGLAISLMVFCRNNIPVKIRSGSEVWTPCIVMSKEFNREVLAVDIDTGRKDENRVRVEIGGIDKETWNLLRENFLFLSKRKDNEIVNTYQGDLLLSEKDKGKIFVKGVFVQHCPNATFGYNFNDADLDRDRRMIETYSLNSYMRRIWSEATVVRPDLMGLVLSALEHSTPDVEGVDEYSAKYCSASVISQAVDAFQARYGKDAIPVGNTGESRDIEHFGKLGVVVPPSLKAILQAQMGTIDSVKEKLAKETTKVFGWHELTAEQKDTITRSLGLVALAVKDASLDHVNVVDYHDKSILGMYQDGKISIQVKCLDSLKDCLSTLVHEYAHREGSDGDKSHVAKIEEIWATILLSLLK